ncbi:MAG: substrate-binding domain-containing protein [Fibrobacter sp.]|nr:substrate-binding domain-containing protein [Fibrobacter sp.]
MRNRLSIGLLINELDIRDDLELGYQSLFWKGVDAEAKKLDINVISFLGGEIRSHFEYQRKRNVIYEHINTSRLDGLIVVTTILGNFITTEELNSFLMKYSALPIVSVGMELTTYPSITVDNYSGMYQLVKHLIEVHNCRHCAFIGGTEQNPESQERLKAFLDAHADAGIPYDPNLIQYAKFVDEIAATVVGQWLTENRQFDAIVAANDLMALGAIRTLELHGITVPEQVKVTGFDNIELSRFLHIPITTIMQPFYKLGIESLRLITGVIHGDRADATIRLPAFPIFRASCGCKDDLAGLKESAPCCTVKQNICAAAVLERFLDIVHKWGLSIDRTDFQQMINCFEADLLDDTSNTFEHSITVYLNKRPHAIVNLCFEFVNLVGIECRGLEIAKKDRAVTICFKAVNAIKNAEMQELSNRILKMAGRSRNLQLLMNYLQSSLGIERLLDDLEENLQRIGINSVFVVLYHNFDKKKGLFILGKDRESKFYKNKNGFIFDSSELIPESLYTIQHQYSLIVQSLFYKHESVGFILVELDSKNGFFTNDFTGFLISGITNAFMSQEIMDSKASLEMANAEIIRNSEILQNAYELLRKNQEQMIASEKIVALGRLTAGISHEINTPLASIGAANNKLSSLIEELYSCLGDPSITTDDYREIFADITRCIEITDKSKSKIAEFVSCIRAHTRDAKEEKQSFNVLDKIRDVELLIGFELRSKKIKLTLDTSHTECTIFGQPQKFTQVVTNLLTNAIDAVRNQAQPHIELNIRNEKSNVVVSVKDNGCGIAPQNRMRIYDPLFTTKPFGTATGMGLTVVHNIVTGEFGGTIDFVSDEGCGTTFILRFPENN